MRVSTAPSWLLVLAPGRSNRRRMAAASRGASTGARASIARTAADRATAHLGPSRGHGGPGPSPSLARALTRSCSRTRRPPTCVHAAECESAHVCCGDPCDRGRLQSRSRSKHRSGDKAKTHRSKSRGKEKKDKKDKKSKKDKKDKKEKKDKKDRKVKSSSEVRVCVVRASRPTCSLSACSIAAEASRERKSRPGAFDGQKTRVYLIDPPLLCHNDDHATPI